MSTPANHKGRLFQGASIDTDDTQVVIQLLVGGKTYAIILPIGADITEIADHVWTTIIDMTQGAIAENDAQL